MFNTVCTAVNSLPSAKSSTPLRLSAFSQQVTGTPDALDFYGSHGTLFLHALAYIYEELHPHTPADSVQIYLKAGLLSNGLISQVMVLGVNAKNQDGTIDPTCAFYAKIGEPHVLTLDSAIRFEYVEAYNDKIYVIENPLVYTALVERLFISEMHSKCTLICPIGHSNAAFLRILERCKEATIYYAGNMDYNGLAAADNLYLKLGKRFKPWRYTKSDYSQILGVNDHLLKKKELSLHNETLASLLSHLIKIGRTASSMPLVQVFAEDISTSIH